MARPKKKVVLFLVEGPSDQESLFVPISKLYHEIDPDILIRFQVMVDRDKRNREKIKKTGDITSKYGIEPDNIEKMINELFFYPFFSANYIYPKDIKEVIHIVDTDGAFIPPEAVIEDNNHIDPYYTDDGIRTDKPDLIIERNEHKRDNLNHLSKINTIRAKTKKVPYSIFYISCNLDHYLHGERNMKGQIKVDAAKKFSLSCAKDMRVFYERFLNNTDCIMELDYVKSWDKIKQGTNSLQAHTNLNILVERLLNEAVTK